MVSETWESVRNKEKNKGMMINMENMLEKMNIKEAAEYIGASVETMRNLVRSKEVTHYRVGNRIMIRKAILDEWIQKQEALNSAGE